jgi:hypothetical protein
MDSRLRNQAGETIAALTDPERIVRESIISASSPVVNRRDLNSNPIADLQSFDALRFDDAGEADRK